VAGKPLDYRQPEKRSRFDWFEWLFVCVVGGMVLYALFLIEIIGLAGP
jgi:hypothetical protein